MTTLPVSIYGPALSPMCSIYSREGPFGMQPGSTHGPSVSGIYDATNRAFYFPMILPVAGLARKFFWHNGATASTNNIQVGVYLDNGSFKPGAALKLGTSTLASGASVNQFDDITDTLLPAGLLWWAIWGSGTTTTLFRSVPPYYRTIRFYQESSLAGGLPSTATPVAPTNVFCPVFGVQFRVSP